MSSDTDVIIIGAGASGLSAARELTRLGLSHIVVEGSHRIGGRAYSEEIAPGVWFDLGCSYLHQGDTNPFVAIADELGVTIGKDYGDIFKENKLSLYQHGVPLNSGEHEAYFSNQNECYTAIHAAADRGEDVAIADLLDLENKYAMTYANIMAATYAQDIDQISSIEVATFEEGPDIPILNGYGNLVVAWGNDIPVSLNTKVERIEYSNKGVSVATSRGALQARTVLSTVSNGILAAGEIEFAPALPDWKLEAVSGLPMGTLNKICVHFDKDIFGPDGRGFHIVCDDDVGAAGFEASVMGQNTAIVFVGGRHAIWLEKQGQQASHEFAVNQVAEVFGHDIRKQGMRSIATAWTTDPWTRGSYSCALPGHAHQRVELARPLDDRLFFAGEATTVGDHACCHGAYRSGIRAAQEIAKVITAC
jgi:monoamine oxidase